LNIGIRASFIFSASANLPSLQALTISDTCLGMQLDATENTPSAPALIMSKVMSSLPERTLNPSGLPARVDFTCSMFPQASLMPQIPGIFASSIWVLLSMLIPVLLGTLYTITGMPAISAMDM
jgi:hypothetical protein